MNDPDRRGFGDVWVSSNRATSVAAQVKQRDMPAAEVSFVDRLDASIEKAIFVDFSSNAEAIEFIAPGRVRNYV